MILRLEAACNNNCRVCTGRLPPGRPLSSPSDLSGRAMITDQSAGPSPSSAHTDHGDDHGRTAVLRGPEPTMASLVLEILERVGPVELHSNGRRFAYESFARRVAPLLERIVLSVHGPDAGLHDWFTRTPGSFGQVLAGAENLARLAVPITVRVPVGRHNLAVLDLVVDLAAGLGADRIRFLALTEPLLEAAGAVDDSFLAVTGLLAGPFLAAAVRRARALGLAVEMAGLSPGDLFGLGPGERQALSLAEAEPNFAPGPVLESGLEPLPEITAQPGASARADMDRAAPAWLHEPSGRIRSVVRTTCRNSCQFCTTRILHEEAGRPWPQDRTCDALAGLIGPMGSFRRRRLSDPAGVAVRFVALEPPEHPDMDILTAAAARWSGGGVQIDSSGRGFADASLVLRLVEWGLVKVDLALLGPNDRIHDLVAGAKGAFRDLEAGLGNLRGKVAMTGHLVLVRDNAAFAPQTLRWAESQGLEVTHVSFAAPASADRGRYAQVAVFLPDWVSAMERLGKDGRRVLSLAAAEVPPCLLPSSLVPSENGPGGRAGRIVHPEGFALGSSLKERRPCPFAESCSLSYHCPGLFPAYLDLFGTHGLRPRNKGKGR